MLKTLALTTCLGLILAAPLATPSLAETYTDPDAAWWGAFLDTLDGTAPDLESQALQDKGFQVRAKRGISAICTRLKTALCGHSPVVRRATAFVHYCLISNRRAAWRVSFTS